jgi:hypothetical protein
VYQQAQGVRGARDGPELDLWVTGYSERPQVASQGGDNVSYDRVLETGVLLDDLPTGRTQFDDNGDDRLTTVTCSGLFVGAGPAQAPPKGVQHRRTSIGPLILGQ